MSAWWTPPQPVISYGVEHSYQGRYADHPAYRRFLARLPELRAAAIRRINQVLGLSYRDNYEILVRFADAGPAGDPARCRRFWRSGAARTEIWSRGGQRLRTIVFCLDPFVRGSIDLLRVLIHELCHAVVSKALGFYEEELPPCFREGLATLVSWEGPERVRSAVAAAGERGPSALLSGLARIESSNAARGKSYFEYYLHTRFLEERGRPDGLARLVSLVARGQRFWEAVAQVTGLRRADYAAASDEAARRILNEMAEANGLADFRRVAGALAENHSQGISALREFLARQPGSLYRPPARFWLAWALLSAGRPGEALAHLTKLRGGPAEKIGLGVDVELLRARALLAAGESASARALLADLLRDEEDLPERVRRALHRLLEEVGQSASPGRQDASPGPK
jgi:hypothetical protein